MKRVPSDLLLLWVLPSGEAEPLAGEGGASPPAEGPAAGGEKEAAGGAAAPGREEALCPGGEAAAEAGEEQGTGITSLCTVVS